MVAVTLSPVPKIALLDSNGRPAVGYKLFTYLAGTTTKTPSYVDSAGVGTNTNPILMDYRGEANVWIPPNLRVKYVFASPTDTDPPANPIWTVDNVVNNQLITLYGGVDTGIANAYVLNFVANFSSYTDGIVIYWTPGNTNTGASTLNVNGLGVVPIINQDGTPLAAGQIVANQISQVIYQSGNFLLLTYALSQGSFVPAWAGFSAAPTGLMLYQRTGNLVTLSWTSSTTGISNANFMTIGNLPIEIRPDASARSLAGMQTCVVIDNNSRVLGSVGHGSLGVVQFNMGSPFNGAGFTAAGVKGLDTGWTFTYRLR